MPNTWQSVICEIQVSGCQFPACMCVKAQVNPRHVNPRNTYGFFVTYSGSSKFVNSQSFSGQYTPIVTPTRSMQTSTRLRAADIGADTQAFGIFRNWSTRRDTQGLTVDTALMLAGAGSTTITIET